MNGIAFKRAMSMFGLKLKKHAPAIMTGLGVAGVIGGTVLACKATYDLKDKLNENEEELIKIKNDMDAALEDSHIDNAEAEEIEASYKKELAIQTGKNVLNIAKMYAVPAIIETTSIALLIGSHGMMQKRLSSLAAAYTTLDAIYRKYRENVREQFGEEVDNDMRHSIKHTKVEEVLVDEDGKEHIISKNVKVTDGNDPNGYGDYVRFFDSSCASWEDNAEYNLMFLKGVQSYCNNLLITHGYLFLNDVYKAIGLDPSLAGQSVGWIYDAENPIGDNYVDFGLFKNNDVTRRFVNGYETVILLDFNVDGDILNNPRLRMWSRH